MVRMAPLPNCFSLVETAISIALRFESARSVSLPLAMDRCSFLEVDGERNRNRRARRGGEGKPRERRVARAARAELAAQQHQLVDGERADVARAPRQRRQAPAAHAAEREVRAEAAPLG